jgi:hypothetical protein
VPATEEQGRSEDAAAPLQDTRKLPAIADRPERAARIGAANLRTDPIVSV